MTTIINGSSPSITFSDSTTQTTAFTSTPSVTSITTSADASISGLTVGKGGGAVASNTAVGASALASNTTGTQNTAIGLQALISNTTGSNNTANGFQALLYNTTGASNTATGLQALYNTTTGSSNTAIGQQALISNTTASNNTAVGYQAGYTNSTGAANTYYGYAAGYTGNGNNNTFIGYGAGYNVSSGSKNTIVGLYNGNQGGLDIRTASNNIVLSDGDGNPRGWFDDAGNFTCGGGTSADLSTTNYGIALRARGTGTQIRYNSNGTTDVNALVGRNTGSDVIYIKSNTGAVQNSTNSYGGISDLRLKENIADATPKLAELQQVRIVNFNLIRDVNKEKQIGVIAQELELIFPSMVDTSIDKDDDGNDLGTTTKTVKYSVFVPMLIKAIQELKTIVDAQATEITALKAKVGI